LGYDYPVEYAKINVTLDTKKVQKNGEKRLCFSEWMTDNV